MDSFKLDFSGYLHVDVHYGICGYPKYSVYGEYVLIVWGKDILIDTYTTIDHTLDILYQIEGALLMLVHVYTLYQIEGALLMICICIYTVPDRRGLC